MVPRCPHGCSRSDRTRRCFGDSRARAYFLHRYDAHLTSGKSINEEGFFRIGGIDQWVTIRGSDRRNPPLLILHGGPGNAFQSLTRRVFVDWEQWFTVVQWDQRGAGKTFGQSGPVDGSIGFDRMVQDAVEMAALIRQRLGHDPVVVGLSWGSLLGCIWRRHGQIWWPLYVGTGQVVNRPAGRRLAYAQLLDEARARRDDQAIRALQVIGPPPYDSTEKSLVFTRYAIRFEPGMPSAWTMTSTVLFKSGVTPFDLRHLMSGIQTSEDHFRSVAEDMDIRVLGTTFEVPFFIFQGDQDNVAPVAQVREYFEMVHAPTKQLVLIANAGHSAIVSKSDEFLRLLMTRVMPKLNR